METAFTPWASLAGGAMIGLAAVLLMLVAGRIMGATGILAGALLPASRADGLWRWVMIAGMVTAPALYLLLTGSWPEITVPVSTPMLLVGGFLVGVGVTFGGGCTSGHGVCGIARLSPRSIVATCVFMAACVATVYVLRHVLGV
ncbi:YeeE/YedE family protein [Hasllibacter sp. MH4015]|uniref:YeeE/YedE family protein n=1 Tax=Hasllibacter sp. MH4015 TaxID=2854029 RepID=UPI001CD60B90|nr:YeeE/YedE thiosulfate transporter family protein [Hasllibacter sp. MH4015]